MRNVTEASLRDIASDAADRIKAAAGDDRAAGSVEARKLKNYLEKQFQKWLGQTGNEASEEALMTFLASKIGYTVENIRTIFDTAGIVDPTRDDAKPKGKLAPNDLSKGFTSAAQFAFKHNLVDTGDKSNAPKASGGARTARSSVSRNTARDEFQKMADKSKSKETNYVADKEELAKALTASGVNKEDLGDLKSLIAKYGNFGDFVKGLTPMERNNTMNQLAKIGFAFFKSQN